MLPDGYSPRTIIVWARTTEVPNNGYILSYGQPWYANAMYIGQNGNQLIGGAFGWDKNVEANGFWQEGVWHQVAITYDGNEAVLYANGSELNRAEHDWNLIANNIYIGELVDESGSHWEGMIDNLEVYDFALNPRQIRFLYNNTKISPLPNDFLIAPTSFEFDGVIKDSIQLSWHDNSDNEGGFIVYLSMGDTLNFNPLDTTEANITNCSIGDFSYDQDLYLRVQAFNNFGISSLSQIVHLNIPLPQPISDEPVLRLSFEGDLTDSSNFNVGAIAYNGSVFEFDRKEGAKSLFLNGQNQYLELNTNTSHFPDGLSPRSISVWAKSTTTDNGYRIIFSYGEASNNSAMFIGQNNTQLIGGGYGNDIQIQDFWQNNEWHHIVLTYDGTSATIYADGMELYRADKSWNLSLSKFFVGNQINMSNEYWNGWIDDLRVYDKALSAGEVSDLYLNTSLSEQPLAVEPEHSIKEIEFGRITTNHARGSAQREGAEGIIAVIGTNPISILPKDGVVYTGGDNGFNSGDEISDGYYVQNFVDDNFEIYNLTADAEYFLSLFPYNGSGDSINYKQEGYLEISFKAYEQGYVWDKVEYEALVDLYEQTGGVNWARDYNIHWLTGGTTNQDFANWWGVFVENGDVTLLSLEYVGMTGEIPESLGGLNRLERMSFAYNYLLSGKIPNSIFHIEYISDIDLSDNELTGFQNNQFPVWAYQMNLNIIWNFFSFSELEKVYTGPGQTIFNSISVENQSTKYLRGEVHDPQFYSIPLEGQIEFSIPLDGEHTKYQWYKKTADSTYAIVGATSNIYSIENASLDDAGNYYCVKTNDWVTDLEISGRDIIVKVIEINNIVDNYDKVLHVDMHGVDSLAVINDPYNPWSLPHKASVAAYNMYQDDSLNYLVYVRKGTYRDEHITMPGIDIFFEEDAVIWFNTDTSKHHSIISDWRGGAGEYNILGKGRFYVSHVKGRDDRDAINFRYNSIVSIECKEFNSLQLWDEFTAPIEFNNSTIRSPQIWHTSGSKITYNNCLFPMGVVRYNTRKLTAPFEENYNNCTFKLPSFDELNGVFLIRDHNNDPLRTFTIYYEDMYVDTKNMSDEQIANTITENYESGHKTVACFEFQPSVSPWQGWGQDRFDFNFNLNNPSFIVNRENGVAVRIIWNETNEILDYNRHGISITGGEASLGPDANRGTFIQSDKRDSEAADIPITVINTSFAGLNTRIYNTTYTPMNIEFSSRHYSIHNGEWSNPNNWSPMEGGLPDGTIPGIESDVVIKGHIIHLSSDSECKSLTISDEVNNSFLQVDGNTINIQGELKVNDSNPENNNVGVQITNYGKVNVGQ